MQKRALALAATPLILGCLALSTPAFAGQHVPAPSGDWNSVVVVDAETGKVLQEISAPQWESEVAMDAETGSIVNPDASPAVDASKPAALLYREFFEIFGWN